MGYGIGVEGTESMGKGVQPVALRKATGAAQGTSAEKVN